MDEPRVEIGNESERVPFDAERAADLIRRILADEGIRRGVVEVTVVGDPAIHRLNAQFLGHDRPTDVLAFEMESNPKEALLEGSVVVSDETALDRARDYAWSAENELLLYVVHGVLHLVGYDDHAPDDERLMRAKEREYLALAGIDAIAGPDDLGKKED
ncbi:MAG: rRNA maturation RNase YbeY [Thermoguttaceae bacterium]|nr:rRNA maturation RNase YbeY [Thermoguttaceae bacterium]